MKANVSVAEMVAEVKKFALANYDKFGMDYVVECYSDEEIAGIVKNCRSVNGAIKAVKKDIAPMNGYRAYEIAGLLANAAIVAAKAKADEDAASAAFSAEVARLKVAYAYLEQGDGPAVAAKNLRKILKREFPGVKFSVTISRFSGGNSMRVSWIDGPTSDQVRQLAELFSGGDFDGSNDLYTYADTPFNSLFGDAKYVSTDRDYSDALIGKAIAELAEEYAPAAAPTVEDYRAGNAWNVSPIEGGAYGRDNWQSLINVKCSEISA